MDRIFDLLDRWRDLPDYQLERRADIFFALYLADMVSAHSGLPLRGEPIPEFPMRHALIRGDGSNRSSKVDYILLSEDRTTAFFIELKTDDGSRRERQAPSLLPGHVQATEQATLARVTCRSNHRHQTIASTLIAGSAQAPLPMCQHA